MTSVDNNFKTNSRLFMFPKITGTLPSYKIDVSSLKILTNINLADPNYFNPAEIGVFLGIGIFWDLLDDAHMMISDGSLHLQETRLGWIVGGKLIEESPKQNISNFCNLTTMETLSNQLKQFWSIEEVNPKSQFTGNDLTCENIYTKTTYRNQSGRFVVTMPLKECPSSLGNNHDVVMKRFLSLERRFEINSNLKSSYINFMQEYFDLRHMIAIDETKLESPFHYIPHHSVYKESSTTTKLRVVFDASCKTSTSLSLNDISHVGPIVQQDLFSILNRFRTHRYAIVADIEKIYRQIEINPSQCNLQLVLWRSSKDQPVKSYQLRTVTYGTACAPFLATRTLIELAEEESVSYPLAAEAAKTDFYVDDFLSGASDFHEAQKLQHEIINMLSKGGFHLRKWCLNESSLLQQIAPEDRTTTIHSFTNDFKIKTLGLTWNPVQDTFHWDVIVPKCCTTKRQILSAISQILSTISQIFDSLGLIGPITVLSKILIQTLWVHNIDWDDPAPNHIQEQWKLILAQSPNFVGL